MIDSNKKYRAKGKPASKPREDDFPPMKNGGKDRSSNT